MCSRSPTANSASGSPKVSFAVHPYKRPTIGNIEELEPAISDEVRRFHATFYRPDNAVLVVAGDFEPADLQRWVDQYFGPIPKPVTPIPRVTVKEPPRTGERTLRDSSPKAAAARAGGDLPRDRRSRATKLPRCSLAAGRCSGGESSRLYRVLVYEKELAQIGGIFRRSADGSRAAYFPNRPREWGGHREGARGFARRNKEAHGSTGLRRGTHDGEKPTPRQPARRTRNVRWKSERARGGRDHPGRSRAGESGTSPNSKP